MNINRCILDILVRTYIFGQEMTYFGQEMTHFEVHRQRLQDARRDPGGHHLRRGAARFRIPRAKTSRVFIAGVSCILDICCAFTVFRL